MGAVSDIIRIGLDSCGFSNNRNYELLPDNSFIDTTRNVNLHNGGVEKRGGTTISVPASVVNSGRGGFHYRKSNGNEFLVYAKSDGNVYHTDDTNIIATGLSTSNFINFSQYDDLLYICDGANIPKVWSGSGLASNVTPATDWATSGYPFQIIPHAQGTNLRNWAVTKDGLYASKNNDGSDFADLSVVSMPISSRGGLVAGYEFNGEIFAFGKTNVYRIDDTDPDTANWGYQEAIWEGGAAHWRLICRAGNEVYVMTEDGNIYNIKSVFSSADYEIASISRPAHIDRFIREKGIIANIENWHCSYDRKLRAIKWFIQVGGTFTNSALIQFIDRPPELAWVIHDNEDFNSGYSASCSFEYRESTGIWKIRTIDHIGNVWQLEELTRGDNGNPYQSKFKFKPWEFGNPVMWKYFRKGIMRVRSDSNVTFTIRIWINGVRKDDAVLSISGTGAVFDVAQFDNAVFADDLISFTPFNVNGYGFNLQLEFVNNTIGQDFFVSEILIAKKDEGIRFDD